MNSTKDKIKWIEMLRAFAILMVILCHSIEAIYSFEPDDIMGLSTNSRVFAFTLFSFGRLGVPFFLMISGYLLLDREYDNDKCIHFWKKNWLHLLICTEIWFIIYDLFLLWFNGRPLTFEYTIEELLFVRKMDKAMNHVWYMPMIIGMYVLIPFVSRGIRSLNKKVLIFPLIIFGLYAFIYPFVKLILIINKFEPLDMQISLGFSGGSYGIYFITGYLVKKEAFKRIKSILLLLTASVSFILTVYYQIWVYENGSSYMVWYNCPLLLICSVSLFILASRITKVRLYKIVHFLSYYSFAVYLVHNIVKTYILKYIIDLSFIKPIQTSILCCLIIIISFPLTFLIKQIPKAGKYILYLK